MTRTRPDFDRTPLRPDRIRHVRDAPSFAFLHHRFLRDGFWASVSRDELLLYLLLVTVADRQGMSFYYDDRLTSMMRVVLDRFCAARIGLVRRDLVAHDPAGPRYQVLSLPTRPVLLSTSTPNSRSPTPAQHARTPGPPAHLRDLIRDWIAEPTDESR
ncbi:MAG: hypothetical protein JW751_15970 [Polyangiaceae bacterium]|nr:hypothetical protein [Polyangiaceae bacterium]